MVFRRGKLTERIFAENRLFTHTEIWRLRKIAVTLQQINERLKNGDFSGVKELRQMPQRAMFNFKSTKLLS